MSQNYLSSPSQQRSSSQPSSSHVVPAISSHYDMYNETDSQRTVRDEELHNSSQGDSNFLMNYKQELKKYLINKRWRGKEQQEKTQKLMLIQKQSERSLKKNKCTAYYDDNKK